MWENALKQAKSKENKALIEERERGIIYLVNNYAKLWVIPNLMGETKYLVREPQIRIADCLIRLWHECELTLRAQRLRLWQLEIGGEKINSWHALGSDCGIGHWLYI